MIGAKMEFFSSIPPAKGRGGKKKNLLPRGLVEQLKGGGRGTQLCKQRRASSNIASTEEYYFAFVHVKAILGGVQCGWSN